LGSGALDLYDLAATSPAAEAFMSELSALADFGEGAQDVSDTAFGAFAIHSLPTLKAEFGRDSEEYKTAVLALEAALAAVSVLYVGRPYSAYSGFIARHPVRKPGSHLPQFQGTLSPS